MTLDLARPRELGALFGDSLRLYFGHFWRFLLIGAAIVVPADLIVSGIGLHQLSGGYDTSRPVAANVVPLVVQALVTTPLIVAITVYLLRDMAEGRGPSVRRAIQEGLDAFTPIFLPMLAAIAAEALLTLALVIPLVEAGNSALAVALVLPLILAVRWYFVPQCVVDGGARRLDALRASWDLTRGFGWRVFGVIVLGYLAFGLVAAIAASPVLGAAKSADSSALVLASQIVSEVLTAPAIALLSALLYFDLKARRELRTS